MKFTKIKIVMVAGLIVYIAVLFFTHYLQLGPMQTMSILALGVAGYAYYLHHLLCKVFKNAYPNIYKETIDKVDKKYYWSVGMFQPLFIAKKHEDIAEIRQFKTLVKILFAGPILLIAFAVLFLNIDSFILLFHALFIKPFN